MQQDEGKDPGEGEYDQLRVILVAATNRPDMLDAALLRPGRIDRKVYVPPPDEGSRKQIFDLELKKMPLGNCVDRDLLVSSTAGFSGAEVVAVVSEAAMLALDRKCAAVTMEHLQEALRGIKPQITPEMLHFYQSMKF
jgi:SpoVK/Ycf46/Vps4 family AAA+-type ATPase